MNNTQTEKGMGPATRAGMEAVAASHAPVAGGGGDGYLWLEISDSQGKRVALQRIHGDVVRVGRAYDNDVVLNDMYAAAHHLCLQRDADTGVWTARDLGSQDGLRLHAQDFSGDGRSCRLRKTAPVMLTTLELPTDAVLQIGQTMLVLRNAQSPVAPQAHRRGTRNEGIRGVCCLVLVLLIAVLGLWLNEAAEPKLVNYLGMVVTMVISVAAWVGVWALVCFVVTKRSRLGRHLLIACVGIFALSVWEFGSAWLGFGLANGHITQYAYVMYWAVAAVVCYAHLRAFGHGHLPFKRAVVGILALMVVVVQTVYTLENEERRGALPNGVLLPPRMRIADPETVRHFLQQAGALQEPLEKARQKKPTGEDDASED